MMLLGVANLNFCGFIFFQQIPDSGIQPGLLFAAALRTTFGRMGLEQAVAVGIC
jgi:hypothetical protein